MADVPMPSALTEEAVAEWVHSFIREGLPDWDQYTITARAVLALCEAKVREAIPLAKDGYYIAGFYDKGEFIGANRVMLPNDDEIVARVLGREVPRGN